MENQAPDHQVLTTCKVISDFKKIIKLNFDPDEFPKLCVINWFVSKFLSDTWPPSAGFLHCAMQCNDRTSCQPELFYFMFIKTITFDKSTSTWVWIFSYLNIFLYM